MSDHLSVEAVEDPDGTKKVTVVFTSAVQAVVVEEESGY